MLLLYVNLCSSFLTLRLPLFRYPLSASGHGSRLGSASPEQQSPSAQRVYKFRAQNLDFVKIFQVQKDAKRTQKDKQNTKKDFKT